MKFTLGLITGFVLGAGCAVAYSVTTGRDLREVYADFRSGLADPDGGDPGAQLEARFAGIQAGIESRIAQVRGQGATAVAAASATADVAATSVSEAAGAAADVAGAAVDAAVDAAVEEQPGS
jgi:hypothetical protein